MGCCCCYTPSGAVIYFTIGVLVCATGGMLSYFMPGITKSQIVQEKVLTPKSQIYPAWVEPPVEIYMEFYFLNCSNAIEFMTTWENGTKPLFQEIGPFTYRHYMRKENITFDGDEIEYLQRSWFVFQPNLSVGTEEDKVVIPNVPLRSVAHVLPKHLAKSVNFMLYAEDVNMTPFVKRTVGDLLFRGYKVDIAEVLRKASSISFLPNDTFGFFYEKENYTEGPFRIHSGANNISRLGEVISFEGHTSSPIWHSPCGIINGTDGSLYPPFMTKTQKLYIFSQEMWRSLALSYKREQTVKNITTYRYEMDVYAFADVNINPDNKCFCFPNASCLPTGLFNVGAVMLGVPILFSGPHFTFSDYRLLQGVDGLRPDYGKHTSFVCLEPTFALPLKAERKAQVNLLVKRVPWFPLADTLPESILPVFWMNERVILDEEHLQMVKDNLQWLHIAVDIVPVVIMSIGGGIGIIAALCALSMNFTTRKNTVSPKLQERRIRLQYAFGNLQSNQFPTKYDKNY